MSVPAKTLADDALSPTMEKILVAAEAEFAARGFDGAGMKAIANRGEVSQALLHYHFGTKERLYADVIAHRSRKINAERRALLEAVDLTAPDALDLIFEALLRPPLGPSGGARPYARIFVGLVVGQERDQGLVREHYDPTALTFIHAIAETLPGANRAIAAQAYSMALGALISVIARDGRVERLMGKDGQTRDVEDILAALVSFCKGGVLALAASGAPDPDNI